MQTSPFLYDQLGAQGSAIKVDWCWFEKSFISKNVLSQSCLNFHDFQGSKLPM